MQIVERALFPKLKNSLSDKRVVVITGMRRVGKTTTLRMVTGLLAPDSGAANCYIKERTKHNFPVLLALA